MKAKAKNNRIKEEREGKDGEVKLGSSKVINRIYSEREVHF